MESHTLFGKAQALYLPFQVRCVQVAVGFQERARGEQEPVGHRRLQVRRGQADVGPCLHWTTAG